MLLRKEGYYYCVACKGKYDKLDGENFTIHETETTTAPVRTEAVPSPQRREHMTNVVSSRYVTCVPDDDAVWARRCCTAGY